MADAAGSMLDSPFYQEMMRKKAAGAGSGEGEISPGFPAAPDHGSMLDTEYYRKRMSGEPEAGAETAQPAKPAVPADYKNMGAGEVAMRGLQALPGSVGNVFSNLGYAATHLPEVGSALWKVGEGGISKAAGALGFEQDKAQKAKTEAPIDAIIADYVKRYGSMEGFKEAVATDPASVLMDLGTFIPGLGVGAKAAGLKGVASVLDKAKYLDPLTAVAAGTNAALTPAMFTAKHILGVSTGTGKGVLDQIQDAARSADRNRMSAVSDFARGSSDPKEAVDDAIRAASEANQADKAAFRKKLGALSQQNLPLTGVMDAFQNARNEIRATIDPATGQWTAPLSYQKELEAINGAEKILSEHKDFTPEGMHELKVAINQYFRDMGIFQGRAKQGALGEITSSIKKTINDVDPKYQEIMDFWAEHLDKLRNLSSGLSQNSRAGSMTQFNKMMKEMKKGKTPLLDILSRYPSGKYLKDKLAGAAMHELFPNWFQQASPFLSAIGGAGLGSGAAFTMIPHIAGTAIASSPRIVGSGVALYGTGQRLGEKLAGKGLGLAGSTLGEMAQDPSIVPPEEPYTGSRFAGGRIARQSGGRVGNPGSAADKLIAAAEKAKNRHSDDTSPLLDVPDEAITKALAIANEKI